MAMRMGFAALAGGFFLFVLGATQTSLAAVQATLYIGSIALSGIAAFLFWRGK